MSVALEARDITKVYGHVSALSGANFEVKAGEVTALIGDNGAGKSTLVKILSGTETPTSGEILVDGQPVTIDGPLAARRYGIETVYQDLALAPHLNPVQNMYLGREIMRPGLLGHLGFMNNTEMRAGSKKAFDELGADSLDVSLVYSRSVESSGDYAIEAPVIQIDRAQGPGTDRRHPKVTPGDENFDATGIAPQDTLHPWPVYLGTITRDPADAWPDFVGWRVNYETAAYQIAAAIDAVPALWSGPRRHSSVAIPPRRPPTGRQRAR